MRALSIAVVWALLVTVLGLGSAAAGPGSGPAVGAMDLDVPAATALPELALDTTPASSRAVSAIDPTGPVPPLLVLMDVSGSMNDSVQSHGSTYVVKMDAARTAALDLLVQRPLSQDFALLAYPIGEGRDGCGGTQTVTGFGDYSGEAMRAIRLLRADGGTPTGPALQDAADYLREHGHEFGTIVLISDGEANCGPAACDVAQSLSSSGIDVVVNTVGFTIADLGSEQLQCIADATGGRHRDVDDVDDLTDAILDASRATLSLAIAVPDVLPRAAGLGPSSGTTVLATVTNQGGDSARDVRVHFSLNRATGSTGQYDPGVVSVSPPVRYLGNLAAGESRDLTFLVRPELHSGNLNWIARVTTSGLAADEVTGNTQVTPIVDRSSMGPLLSDVQHAVVIGDSYSSGEGAGPYLPGTHGSERGANRCHRSNQTYAAHLFPGQTTIIACSGAVTADLSSRQYSNRQPIEPQARALREVAMGDNPPDAVFMTIGGNDVGFADFLTQCITGPWCVGPRLGLPTGVQFPTDVMKFVRRAENIGSALRDSYRLIDIAVNDAAAIANRDGHIVPIIVLPYVRITPNQGGVSGCVVGVSEEELAFANAFLDILNRSIRDAVAQQAGSGRPIYYADDVVEAFQPGNTLCEGTNGYAVPFEAWRAVPFSEPQQEIAHPNANGHVAIAHAIAAWSRSPSAIPQNSAATQATWESVAPEDPGILRPVLRFVLTQGGGAVIRADDFLPGSQVRYWIESTPAPLGSGTVRDDGTTRDHVAIPAHLTTGSHTISIEGIGAAGEVRIIEQPVTLHPPGTNQAILLIIGATLSLLLACCAVLASLLRGRAKAR